MRRAERNVLASCPKCGGLRTVTERTARRGVAICYYCRHPEMYRPVSDTERRYMLAHLTDEEILFAAETIWGESGRLETVHEWRERLDIKEPERMMV